MKKTTYPADPARTSCPGHAGRPAPSVGSIAAAAGLLLAALAAPALGQSASFDISKHLDLQVAASPTTIEVDWTRRLRAVARVGTFCRDASGFTLTPTVPFVAPGTLFSRIEFADAGQNNLCTASAQATARWNILSPTRFTMDVRSLGSANPRSDRCIGHKMRPARAHARAKSILTMYLDGLGIGAGTKGFSAAWVNNHNTLQGFRQRAKLLRDPVVASLYDSTGTTLLGSWEIINVESRVFGNGQTSMSTDDFGLVIDNSAASMDLTISVGATIPSIVSVSDRGLIQISVRNGVVTQRTVNGRFAAVTGIPALNSNAGTTWLAHIDMTGIDYDMQVPAGTPTRVKFDMGGSSHSPSEDGLVAPACSLISNLDDGFGGADVSVVPAGSTSFGYSCRAGDKAVLENLAVTAIVQPDFLVVPYYIEGAAPGTSPTAVYVRLYNGNPATGGAFIYGSVATSQDFGTEDIEAYRVLPSAMFDTTRAINEAVIDLSSAPVLAANTNLWVEVSMDYPGAAAIGLPWSPYSDNAVDNAMSYSFTTGQYAPLADATSGRFPCMPFEFFGLAPDGCYPDLGTQGGVPGQDGQLDNNDFIIFINYFFDANPIADVGSTGGVRGADGQFNNNDFVIFIDLFFQGC